MSPDKYLQIYPESLEETLLMSKYQVFFNYIYGPLLNSDRRHRVFVNNLIDQITSLPILLHEAMKTNQVSRVRVADANIASIRSALNLCPHPNPKRRIIARNQVRQAQIFLCEVGAIIGTMKNNLEKTAKR